MHKKPIQFSPARMVRLYPVMDLVSSFFHIIFFKSFRIINYLFAARHSSYFIAGASFYLVRIEGINYEKICLILASCALSIIYSIRVAELSAKYFSCHFSLVIIISIISLFYLFFIFLSLGLTKKKW